MITPRQLDDFQPHQVRKKEALAARFDRKVSCNCLTGFRAKSQSSKIMKRDTLLAGLSEAGYPVIKTRGLRIDELGFRADLKVPILNKLWVGSG